MAARTDDENLRLPPPLTTDEILMSARAQQLARNCLGTPLESCAFIAQRYGIPFPEGSTKEAMLARFRCKDWWRRNLRKVHGRAVDQLGREFNLVCYGRQIYVTEETVQARRDRKQRNDALMHVMEVVNELDEAFTLAELKE